MSGPRGITTDPLVHLVVGRLKVLAQLIGGEKQLRLEAKICPVAVGLPLRTVTGRR
jgi:hypothetical protein